MPNYLNRRPSPPGGVKLTPSAFAPGPGRRSFRGHGQPTQTTPIFDCAFALLWIFIFTIPFENVLVIPGLGTLAHLVGIVAFAGCALGLIDRGWLQRGSVPQMLMFAFALWRILTYFWTPSPESTTQEIGTVLQLVAMIWLLRQMATTKELQIRIIQAYVVGTCVSSCDTIFLFLSGASPTNYLRYSAQGFDPNELSLMLVLSVPLSLYLSLVKKGTAMSWIYRVQMVLAVAAMLLTGSRGPFIAFLGASLFVPLTFFRWTNRQRATFVIVMTLVACASVYLIPATSWTRLASISDEVSHGTFNDRTIIWRAGLEVFRMHPVFGIGAGAFNYGTKMILGYPWVAHNTFLSVLVEEGLVGFGLLLLLVASLIAACLRMPSLERRLWLVMMLTLSIGIFSLTWEYRKPLWLILCLISMQESVLGTAAVGRRRFYRKVLPSRRPVSAAPYVTAGTTLPNRV